MSSISLPKVNSSEENIKCYLRCKPLSQSESELDANCIKISPDRKTVNIDCSSITKPEKTFLLDSIFPSSTTQSEIFQSIGLPMLSSFINGYNCTIFAYGQTGAGKTHTILGPLDALYDKENELHGLVPRILSSLFDSEYINKELDLLYDKSDTSIINYKIKCSCLEIYQEHLVDLLSENENEDKLIIREDQNKSMYIENLTKVEIFNDTSAKELLMKGMENRHVASTKMNSQSSRSHLIFTIFLETSCDNGNGKIKSRSSRLNIIDLAGSERQKSTEATGDRIKEAGNINKSLSILGNVINALIDSKNKFVPFRDSKLTYLLKDSLGGNSKTMIIANISQSVVQFAETLSTLKFVQRAKMITNKTAINENISDVEKISNLENEIKRLKEIIKGTTNAYIETVMTNDINNNNSIDAYNDLLNKVNIFIGYEELICKKLKFLDLIGANSLKQFMEKKKKFDDDIERYIINTSESDNKVFLLKQEVDLYKHINQYYSNRNLIENCQSTFTSEFISKLSELHDKITVYFDGKFNVKDLEKNQMILVDKNEYHKMEMKIKELKDSEEEKKKAIETLENENFLIKMEMMKIQNEDDEECNISKEVSEFSNCTPKKEKEIVSTNSSENKFLEKLRQSLMKPNCDSNSSKKQNDQIINLKRNYDSAIKENKDKEEMIKELQRQNEQLNNEIRELNEEIETLNETNEIYKKDLINTKAQSKDIKEMFSMLNKNNILINELSSQYDNDIDDIFNFFYTSKAKKEETEQIALEREVFILRNERKNLMIELNLLNNELNYAYENYKTDDIVNAKLRILTRLKKQNEKKDNDYDTLLNFIINKFGDKNKVNESNKGPMLCIEILNDVLEKIELQNFYLDNQYKENTSPNVNANKMSNMSTMKKSKGRQKSRLNV